MNSFRLKIAILSSLVSGALLLGFAMVLWRGAQQFNLDQLDREIRNLGQENLHRVPGPDHWARLETALRFVSGEKASPNFVLWVKNNQRVVYQSASWPAGLDPGKLPVSENYDGSNPTQAGALPPPPRRGEEISPRNPALPRREARFYTRPAQGVPWRIGVMGNPYITLAVAVNTEDFNRRMNELRNAFLATVPGVLVVVALGGWFVAGRALRPVRALTQAAEGITAQGLDRRISTVGHDREFNKLIAVFNAMLNRLQSGFEQATRFSADASHELKSPLARLQVELEDAMQQAALGSREQEVFSNLLEETIRLKSIVEKLLILSLADAGRLTLHRETIPLSAAIEELAEDCKAQAPHLRVELTVVPEVEVQADPALLHQALQNLVSNAIKYNMPEGKVCLHLEVRQRHARFRISNSGPGIPSNDQDRLFERFYRADKARSTQVEGSGLGLSLSREILRAHDGDLVFDPSTSPVTTFEARLPIEQPHTT